MAKKQYKIRARLVFNGQVMVSAHSRQEAEAIVEKGIAGQLGKVEVQPSVTLKEDGESKSVGTLAPSPSESSTPRSIAL